MSLLTWEGEENLPTTEVEKKTEMLDRRRNITQAMESLKEEREAIDASLLALVPEEPGERTIKIGSYAVTIKRAERWSWDSQKVADVFGGVANLPDYVKKNFSIDKRKFERLPPSDRDLLLDALTRGLGAAKIEVTEMAGDAGE